MDPPLEKVEPKFCSIFSKNCKVILAPPFPKVEDLAQPFPKVEDLAPPFLKVDF
jgi:hypothetical protein